MAVTLLSYGHTPQKGINYTAITDSSADWTDPTLPNNTYFYDKGDKLPHYKDSSGNILEVFSGLILTTTGTSGAATLVGSTLNIPQYSGGGGGSAWTVTTQTGASYTAANNNYVLINAATHVLTLPAASANARIGVKMINATVTSIQVRTASAGVTIDGVDRSSVGLGIFNQYDAYVFISDGTNWFIES